MIESLNNILENKNNRKFLLDAYYYETKKPKPVVIFVHGFKGFKDWGSWKALMQQIAKNNFIAISFNFSHNGTTIENPTEFSDLEAFGQNNFEKEMDDLGEVLNWIENDETIANEEINFEKINLLGHSRGGGIVICKAAEEERINKVCTLASVSNFFRGLTDEAIEEWKTTGKREILNTRINLKMPLYFQLFENYKANENRLHVGTAAHKIENKVLIVHGTEDKAVPLSSAHDLKNWIKNAEYLEIEGANHVFGAKHPWNAEELPQDLEKVFSELVPFFNG